MGVPTRERGNEGKDALSRSERRQFRSLDDTQMKTPAVESAPSRCNNRFLAILLGERVHPVVVAHRGDSFRAPENTLEAARLGWEAGATAWEMDVQLTRDGVPIVLHDESLLRTTDVAQKFAGDARGGDGFRLSDFDLDEVRSLDAGSWFVSEEGGGRSARDFGTLGRMKPSMLGHYASGRVKIPTLVEALTFTREQDWLVNVEIKSFPERPRAMVEPVLQVIAATETSCRVLISSFDHRDVAAANVPGREYALGILAMTPLHQLLRYARELVGADTVHLSRDVVGCETVEYRTHRSPKRLESEVVADLSRGGVPILVYTVNDHGRGSLAEDLAAIGVAGFFTDDPLGMTLSFSSGPAAP
jgi:glycerophosphoryl diester phosphodiesterase